MVRKANIVTANELAGGKGVTHIHHIISGEEFGRAGKMFAKVVLEPGASIGWHRHTGETEPYYVLEGRGVFVDNDGTRTEVGPGDCCIIEEGQCHGIENASSCLPFVFMALIYNV